MTYLLIEFQVLTFDSIHGNAFVSKHFNFSNKSKRTYILEVLRGHLIMIIRTKKFSQNQGHLIDQHEKRF